MAKRQLAAGLTALVLSAGAAQSEGWTVIDFEPIGGLTTCMNYAETTFNTYRTRFGQDGFTGRSTWTIGGYDLSGPDVDALFICLGEEAIVDPVLVLFNVDDDSDRREGVGDLLSDIWDEVVAGNGFPQPGGGPAPVLPSK